MRGPDRRACERQDLLRRCARDIGLVALAFSLLVAVVLSVHCRSGGQLETVRSAELAAIMTAARQASAPAEATALAVRMDRLARHACFDSVGFRQTGIVMLIVGLLVGAGCLHLAWRLGRWIEDPRRGPVPDAPRSDRRVRLALLLLAGILAGGACIFRLAAGPADRPAAHPSEKPGIRLPSGGQGLTWACFRGPAAGVAAETNMPIAWDGRQDRGVRWKAALSKPGWSSPVLAAGHVYVTEADEAERAVQAFDAGTGTRLWRHAVMDGGGGDAMPATFMDTGLAAPTAACDGDGVYAVFATGDLVAFSHGGVKRWQVYLRRPDNPYGHASSLWVGGGLVCVQYDQRKNGRLLAIDAATGKTRWEKPRTLGAAWSSPIVFEAAGRRMLVVNGNEAIEAFDVETGESVWQVEGVKGEVAPSPATWNGRLYAANDSSRLVCYDARSNGTPSMVWQYDEVLPDVASPVAAGGLLFLATSRGQIACLDAVTGKEQWRHEYATGCYASPIVCGDRLYALDRDGTMRILAANRTFREIASCPTGEAADATPAFGDGCIFIRSQHRLWCVGGHP